MSVFCFKKTPKITLEIFKVVRYLEKSSQVIKIGNHGLNVRGAIDGKWTYIIDFSVQYRLTDDEGRSQRSRF